MWIRIRIRNTGKNSPAMKQKEEDSEGHAEDGDGEPGVGDVRQPDIVRPLSDFFVNWSAEKIITLKKPPGVRNIFHSTVQMKGRWESNVNVWFPFMYSKKRNCYFHKRIIMFCLPVPTLIYLWEIYIFSGSVCLFCCWSWEYINHSQTHEWGNWDWGRAIPRKEIHKWDFLAVQVFISFAYIRDVCVSHESSYWSHCRWLLGYPWQSRCPWSWRKL